MKLKANCSICSIEFTYKFNPNRKRKYCSLKCIQKKSYIKRESKCNWCHKIYKRGSADIGKFCSMPCKGLGARLTESQKLIKIKSYYEKNVIRQDGCWGWNGAVSSNGYGAIGAGRKTKINAHRAAWILYKGKIPKKMQVMHSCDNRLCSNYMEHLSLGTAKDNSLDMISKGRGNGHFNKGTIPINAFSKGAIPSNRKLIASQVIEIKKLRLECFSVSQIIKQTGIKRHLIERIIYSGYYSEIKI